jgi:hypothetical protein
MDDCLLYNTVPVNCNPWYGSQQNYVNGKMRITTDLYETEIAKMTFQ